MTDERNEVLSGDRIGGTRPTRRRWQAPRIICSELAKTKNGGNTTTDTPLKLGPSRVGS